MEKFCNSAISLARHATSEQKRRRLRRRQQQRRRVFKPVSLLLLLLVLLRLLLRLRSANWVAESLKCLCRRLSLSLSFTLLHLV